MRATILGLTAALLLPACSQKAADKPAPAVPAAAPAAPAAVPPAVPVDEPTPADPTGSYQLDKQAMKAAMNQQALMAPPEAREIVRSVAAMMLKLDVRLTLASEGKGAMEMVVPAGTRTETKSNPITWEKKDGKVLVAGEDKKLECTAKGKRLTCNDGKSTLEFVAAAAPAAPAPEGAAGSYRLDKAATQAALDAKVGKAPAEAQEKMRAMAAAMLLMDLKLELAADGKGSMEMTPPAGPQPAKPQASPVTWEQKDGKVFVTSPEDGKKLECSVAGTSLSCDDGKAAMVFTRS